MGGRDKRFTIRTGDDRAGHVAFDTTGKAVRRWEGGEQEGATTLRRRLANDDLELEPTRQASAARASTPKAARSRS